MNQLDLPAYTAQAPEVADRFRRMYERPKVMEVKHLGMDFQSKGKLVQALHDVNFDVYRREFICVIGPSGCGKSTLIRILAGLEIPTHGTVELDGKVVEGPGRERGMVFQGYTLFPWLTVKKNIMFGPSIDERGAMASEQEANQWLNMVGLERFADSYPHELSGGMKQRVAIARALANHPRILLMDEPFGALDAQTRAKMQEHLLRIWQNVNLTILFITHDLDEAVYLADRIVVLGANPGHIVEIIENPVKRPRDPDQFVSPEFLSLKFRLQELIHPPQEEDKEEIPIVKMTDKGDEVW